MSADGSPRNRPVWHREAVAHALVFLALTAAATYCLTFFQSEWKWAGVWQHRWKFIYGWWATVWISVAALILSFSIGLLVALGRRAAWAMTRSICLIYVGIIRSTPLLVQILIFFYVVGPAFHLQNRWVAGILILAIFSGAYVAEIIRAGLEGIPDTQWESARAIGLSKSQVYRHVIFPQALRLALPGLAGEFVNLIKNSSLLSVIGISELTCNAQEVNSYTFSTLESYLPLALGYLVLTLPLAGASAWLEKRLHYES